MFFDEKCMSICKNEVLSCFAVNNKLLSFLLSECSFLITMLKTYFSGILIILQP